MADQIEIETLTRYKSWADHVFYQSLRILPEKELAKQRPMLFGNILTLLNHVFSMDVAWRCNLEGVAHDMSSRKPKNTPSFTVLREKQNDVNLWFEYYVAQRSTKELSERVSFTFIGGGEGKMRRSEIIQHVVNHASYHRGHIEGVLYQMLIEPPTTDMPVFLQEYAG